MIDEEHDPKQERALFIVAQLGSLISKRRNLPRGEQAARLRELAQSEQPIPGSSKRRLSLTTWKRYLAKLRGSRRLDSLFRKPRSDKGGNKAIPEEALERAKLAKQEEPRRSVPVIIEMLEGSKIVEKGQIRPSTLRRQLRQAGYTQALLLGDTKAYERFERDAPGDLWQADAADGIYLPDPDKPGCMFLCKLFLVVDDHSRLCVGARFYPNQQQAALDDCFQRALVRWGVPCNVYVDRGNVFVSKHFERVCAEVGTHLIKASVGYPEGKGKVERLVKTVKSAFYPEAELLVKQGKLRTLEQLNEYVDAFVEEWYNRRPHSELAGKSPREVWGPEPIRPVEDLARIKEAFLWRLKRQVQKDCCFQVEGVRFRTCPELARQKVEVAYDPLDLSYALVFQEGVRMDMARPENRPAQVGKRQQPEERKAPPSGLSFLELLRKDHEDHLKQELAGLSFRQPPSQGKEPASRLVVVRLLEGVLHRPLNHLELARVEEEWRRGGPLDPTPRAEALARLVADIGPDRHIGEYLKCLRGR